MQVVGVRTNGTNYSLLNQFLVLKKKSYMHSIICRYVYIFIYLYGQFFFIGIFHTYHEVLIHTSINQQFTLILCRIDTDKVSMQIF
jgi:hypothetical protein